MTDTRMTEDNSIFIKYTFLYDNGSRKTFEVNLQKGRLNLISLKKPSYPPWTKLDVHQCPHCPLDIGEYPYCPIAANICDLIEQFVDTISFEEAEIIIETSERTYQKRTAIQYGISALLGIHMVTSGCPIMEKLKPMVRFHLPFATPDETTYRALTMYILAQYLLTKRGKKPDLSLKGLTKIYEDINLLNKSFLKRLSMFHIKDANLNAIGILGTFASYVIFTLDDDFLTDFDELFHMYLED